MDFKRSDRVAGLFKEEIARMLIKGLKDPRVRSVVITGVRVSDDLRNARVFFTLLDEQGNREDAQKGLMNARGFIRRELGMRLDIKYMPDLTFSFDHSIEYGRRIEQVLKDLREKESSLDPEDSPAELEPNGIEGKHSRNQEDL